MIYTLEHQKQGTELLKILVERAWKSTTFKDMLIKDPHLAIKEVTGKSFILPENKKLSVEDQTNESVIYLNIPIKKQDYSDFELTDEQLEVIAGGEVLLGTGIGIVIGIGLCWAVSNL